MPTKCIICNKTIESSFYVKYVCIDCRINHTEKIQPKKKKPIRKKKKQKQIIYRCSECGTIITKKSKYCDFCKIIADSNNKKRTKQILIERKKTVDYNYEKYKKCAIKRKIEFNLTINEFSKLWQKDCFYCGSEIKTIGVDRVDSKKGYSVDNIVPCCTKCNFMKYTHSKEIFIDHIKKIYDYQININKSLIN